MNNNQGRNRIEDTRGQDDESLQQVDELLWLGQRNERVAIFVVPAQEGREI